MTSRDASTTSTHVERRLRVVDGFDIVRRKGEALGQLDDDAGLGSDLGGRGHASE
jgi:hypothetical protein